MLSLLSRTAYASILKCFQALLDRNDVRPGCVFSLQTFGAYGANLNPHCHDLVTDGAFSPDGQFLPLPSFNASAVTQLFRRLLLLRLHQARRLSESFMRNLLTWVHSGFSVYAGSPVDAAESASVESRARYITRPPLAMDALRKLDDGSLVLHTPPDPRIDATSLVPGPLEWIHRITSHIPDPGKHRRRFYRAYCNRGRIPLPAAARHGILLNPGRLRLLSQTLCNNSEAAPARCPDVLPGASSANVCLKPGAITLRAPAAPIPPVPRSFPHACSFPAG